MARGNGSNIRIKRKGADQYPALNKYSAGQQSLPDLSKNRGANNADLRKRGNPKVDYLAEMRLNREDREIRKPNAHRTIEQVMNDDSMNE